MASVAGIDVGAMSLKAVVLDDSTILGRALVVCGEETALAARSALEEALAKTTLSPDGLDFVVATGVGRNNVPFAQKKSTEVACQAKASFWLYPSARTVINLGGESSRVIRLSAQGKVERFTTNEKCAAGSGLFLESMARVLEVPLEEMGAIALSATASEEVASMCAVFAESEIISHVHRGVPKEQILAGLHDAVADRIVEIINRVGAEPEVVISGGVALNPAIIKALEGRLGLKLTVPPEPQLHGALGAALVAVESLGRP